MWHHRFCPCVIVDSAVQKKSDRGNANPHSNLTSLSTYQIDQSFKYGQQQRPVPAREWETAGTLPAGTEGVTHSPEAVGLCMTIIE